MIGKAPALRHTRLAWLAVTVSGLPSLLVNLGMAAEPAAKLLVKDVAYANKSSLKSLHGQMLDLYGPEGESNASKPVMLYVHGGGWRRGDKAMVGSKPKAFVDRGYLFASANYRLEESVSPREQAEDVATAVKWLHEHVGEFGGDPGKIFLMGHSAGAHLVALVGTDERLLKACGLDLAAVRGVVLLDGAGYDVPRQVAAARLPMLKELYKNAFGEDARAQREASPVEHVVNGKAYPPFLLFHVGQRQDSQEQSELLATKLRAAGGQASVIHEPDKNHMTLNRELGLPDDGPTGKVLQFLEGVLDRKESAAY